MLEPESKLQSSLHTVMHRTRIETTNEELVEVRNQHVYMTVSTAYSSMQGRPRTDCCEEPNVAVFARATGGLARHMDAMVARPLRKHRGIDITGRDLVNMMEQEDTHRIYLEEERENWPGTKFHRNQERGSCFTPLQSIVKDDDCQGAEITDESF